MERWRGSTALVTGAASEIGRAVTMNLLKNGLNVFACDRHIKELRPIVEEIGAPVTSELIPIHCNSSKEEDILAMFENIKRSRLGGIEVCVNNAGISHSASHVSRGDTEEWRQTVNVNLLGLALCTREALKSMESRGVQNGHIINISSYLSREVLPGGALYTATEEARRGFAEELTKELLEQKSMIRVTQISPGMMKTLIFNNNKSVGDCVADTVIHDSPHLLPADIASAVEFALSAPKHVQIHEIQVRPIDQPDYGM